MRLFKKKKPKPERKYNIKIYFNGTTITYKDVVKDSGLYAVLYKINNEGVQVMNDKKTELTFFPPHRVDRVLIKLSGAIT